MGLVMAVHEELPNASHILCKFHLTDNWQLRAGKYGLKEALIGEKAHFSEFWVLLKGLLYFDLSDEYTLAVVRDILEDFIVMAREKNMDRNSYLQNFYRNYLDKIYLTPDTRSYHPRAVSGNLYKQFLDCNYTSSTSDAEISHKQINSLFDDVALSKR